jgi:hypothetical protein
MATSYGHQHSIGYQATPSEVIISFGRSKPNFGPERQATNVCIRRRLPPHGDGEAVASNSLSIEPTVRSCDRGHAGSEGVFLPSLSIPRRACDRVNRGRGLKPAALIAFA